MSDRGRAFRAFATSSATRLRRGALRRDPGAVRTRAARRRGDGPRGPSSIATARPTPCASSRARTADDVDFYLYLQWQADVQLAHAAQQAARDARHADRTLPRPGRGRESRRRGDVAAIRDYSQWRVHIGAPPDEFNQKGQDWGLPPWIPHLLRGDRVTSHGLRCCARTCAMPADCASTT